MSAIHPTAIVETGASIAPGVEIGPYCHVGPQVTLKEGVRLLSHVVIAGCTTLEEQCSVYPFASIGHQPQDLKYKGELSTLHIGAHTIIREYVTIQPGTSGGEMTTRVGQHCHIMIGAHIAHDCIIGNHVRLTNNATLGGHVQIGDYAIIGGLAAIHQFVRIGEHAMIGGTSGVSEDVIPYGLVTPGRRGQLDGLNLIGLKRHGFSLQDIQLLREAYRRLFEAADPSSLFQERLTKLRAEFSTNPATQKLFDFIAASESRKLCFPHTYTLSQAAAT